MLVRFIDITLVKNDINGLGFYGWNQQKMCPSAIPENDKWNKCSDLQKIRPNGEEYIQKPAYKVPSKNYTHFGSYLKFMIWSRDLQNPKICAPWGNVIKILQTFFPKKYFSTTAQVWGSP